MSNISLSYQVIESLLQQGLKHFVVCAGARNAPLLKSLVAIEGIEVDEYFEERAAAFYALGISKATGRPAAVVTTSGTAVAELYPAIMEAHYSGVPLVAITADRPASFRGSGAPQSVEQPGLFAKHVAKSYDFSVDHFKDVQLYKDSPVHINLCFDEPLIDEEIVAKKLDIKNPELPSLYSQENFSAVSEPSAFSKPLVILGALNEVYRDSVKKSLLKLGAPVYAEAHSGLRESKDLSFLMIKSGEVSLKPGRFEKHFDSVIRIGGVPTLRLWRDLEAKLIEVPVANFSNLPFSGLSRSQQVATLNDLSQFLERVDTKEISFNSSPWVQQLDDAKISYPKSEVSILSAWISKAEEDTNVLLGNSLPIREWELAAPFESKAFRVYSNRGVNGIDGLLAAACGLARGSGRLTYVVLGDLSFLYDLSSLALISRMKDLVKPVVLNNGGGMIFRRMFEDEHFENRHNWSLSKAAEVFEMSSDDITELCPDNEASDKFWQAYLKELS